MAELSASRVNTRRVDAALVVLRVVAGIVFATHGGQKLFVFGFAGVAQGFTAMHVPLPGIVGPAVGLLEFFGGIALVLGVLTRLAALGLALDMLGAIVLVHLAGGFFVPRGVEFTLTLFTVCVALVLAGPGAYSIDEARVRRSAG